MINNRINLLLINAGCRSHARVANVELDGDSDVPPPSYVFFVLFDYSPVYCFLMLVVDRVYLLLRSTMTAILISLRSHREIYFSDMLTLSTLITLFGL